MIAFLLNCAIILLLPFAFSGLMAYLRHGRKHGVVAVVAPLTDFLKLLSGGVKAGSDRNFFHETATSVILASILMAGALTPLVGHKAILNFEGAFLLFFAFLVIEKIVRVFGKKSPGKSERKIVLRDRAESLPEAVVYAVLVLSSIISGQNTFGKLFSFGGTDSIPEIGVKVLFILSLWLIIVREEGDETFGYEGSDRAAVLYGGSLKSLLIASLMAGMVIPYTPYWETGLNAFLYLILYLALVALIGAVAAFAQRLLARYGKTRVPDIALAVSAVFILGLSFLTLMF